ncbi:alpha/beta-hydrolase, partial [Conidiobolus coronatus NRRL 28638]
YASAAYCPQAKLTSWNCTNCVGYASNSSEVIYFQNAGVDSAGYIAVNKILKLIVLSYRGTNDLSNWLYDTDIKLTSAGLSGQSSNAQIHSGFNDMAMSLLSQTTSSLKSAIGKYPDYKVVITGHSLGGAIASLIGFQLGQANVVSWDKLNVITYGQPRIGNPDFATYLNTKPWTFTRVTSYSDLVAISPGISMGFYHNQNNMHINSS